MFIDTSLRHKKQLAIRHGSSKSNLIIHNIPAAKTFAKNPSTDTVRQLLVVTRDTHMLQSLLQILQ